MLWPIVLAAGLAHAAERGLAPWYEAQIAKAQASCAQAKARLSGAEVLERRAVELLGKAEAEDVEGKDAAERARDAAARAAAKSRFGVERSCGAVERLRARAAADDAGAPVLLHARGEILVDGPKGPVKWDGKTPLAPGQRLSTGKDGYAELALPGHDGVLALGPRSSFVAAGKEGGGPLLKAGRFLFRRRGAEAGDEPEFHVVDKTIVVAVRGTRFAAVAGGAGDGGLFLFEGELSVAAPGAEKPVVMKPGQTVSFKGGKLAGPPAAFEPKRAMRAWGGTP